MITSLIKKMKNENGQSLVELALALPVLIMILGGIIDFGWLFMHQNVIDHCSRDGARYAMIHSDSVTDIENHIIAIAPEDMADSIVVGVSFSNTSNPRLGDVEVTVSSDVEVLTPIAGVFLQGQTVNLDASCTMKVE